MTPRRSALAIFQVSFALAYAAPPDRRLSTTVTFCVAAVVVSMFHSAGVSVERLGGSAVVKTCRSRFGVVK